MNGQHVILQRSGLVPEIKGPYHGRMLEDSVRELYRLYPGAVVIVMSEKLPPTCYPQHGQEFLDMADSETSTSDAGAPPCS
jgi:hypothetical protein